jgi:hypothetical protein
MPTLVKSKNRIAPKSVVKSKTRPAPEPDEETESDTKAETKIIVDKGLATLVKDWDKADKVQGSYWVKIAEYVSDNDISRAMLKKALMDLRGMAELTANNEVSKIFKLKDAPEVLEQLVNGDITIKQAKEAVTKKQEGTDDAETKVKKGLHRLASVAIQEVEAEQGEFVQMAKTAYRETLAKLQAKAAKEEGEGEEGEDEEGEEGEEE